MMGERKPQHAQPRMVGEEEGDGGNKSVGTAIMFIDGEKPSSMLRLNYAECMKGKKSERVKSYQWRVGHDTPKNIRKMTESLVEKG